MELNHKKVHELDDECNIHQWYDELKTKMLQTFIIQLTRKEINALKLYTTYWFIYKKHIIANYNKMKQDPSLLDPLPNNLCSVIEMHFKTLETPHQDHTKWGERFNYSLIDGMEKYVDSIQCLQSKISEALCTIHDKENESIYYVLPKLSTDLSLPFDSIYESMSIFDILNEIPNPETNNGYDILCIFHNAVWKSLQYKANNKDTFDILDIFCRSGLILQKLNLALLKFSDEDEDDNKQNEKETLSIILQLYCIPNDLKQTQSIMDTFLEFRMFIGNNIPTGITQIGVCGYKCGSISQCVFMCDGLFHSKEMDSKSNAHSTK